MLSVLSSFLKNARKRSTQESLGTWRKGTCPSLDVVRPVAKHFS